jgi:single-strand selective monofunctional uracil DNA glycosylase
MLSHDLIHAAQILRSRLAPLQFSHPVAHVYNPLEYAGEAHQTYLEKFGHTTGRIVLLGMNPGPYGMMQVGVPFGEVTAVRDWMGITSGVQKPKNEHPKRPIHGFDCTRSEVSGRRLWAWAQQDYGSAEQFFNKFFVLNYCPLIWLEEGGKNRTPEQLPSKEMAPVYEACDDHLRHALELLKPSHAIGIGGFALKRISRIVEASSTSLSSIKTGTILHPSPASPAANRGWAEQVRAQLAAQGI